MLMYGSINLEHFKELMSDKVGLVTCMYVNNVTGQIQPIPQMAEVIKIILRHIFM